MNVEFTDAAADQLRVLLESDFVTEPVEAMRVFVQGGGCNGFQYGFAFESEIAEDDQVFEKDDVKFVVDPMSMMYLQGAIIDFKTTLMGSQFTIDNPNVTTTCGCGNSMGF